MPDPKPENLWEDAAAFDGLAVSAETATKKMMRRLYERHRWYQRDPGSCAIAVAIGTIVMAGRLLRAVATNQEVAERLAVANLRGALRGLDAPVREDGQPYTGALDA